MHFNFVFVVCDHISGIRILPFLERLIKAREADGGLLSVFIVHELQHHLDVLGRAFVGGILSSPVDHYFGNVIHHLEVRFHFLVRGWVDVWLNHELVALFAALLTLCRKVERGWVELLDITRLAV